MRNCEIIKLNQKIFFRKHRKKGGFYQKNKTENYQKRYQGTPGSVSSGM